MKIHYILACSLALAVPCSIQAATWMGQAEDEYHASGAFSGLPFTYSSRSGDFQIDLSIPNPGPDPSDSFREIFTWLDFYSSLSAPWDGYAMDFSGLREDLGIGFEEGIPKVETLSLEAGGIESFYYGDYNRSYGTRFSAVVEYVYDGSEWTGSGTWEYHSVLFEESGRLPVLPETVNGGLALGLSLLGAAAVRRKMR